jgi:hypothetical protein
MPTLDGHFRGPRAEKPAGEVELLRLDPATGQLTSLMRQASADGRFQFYDLAASNGLRVVPHFPGMSMRAWKVQERQMHDLALTVRPARALDLHLVIDGKPAAHAQLRMWDVGRAEAGAPFAPMTCDGEGRCHLDDAIGPMLVAEVTYDGLGYAVEERLWIADGPGYIVDIHSGPGLEGRLVDAEEHPLPLTKVRAAPVRPLGSKDGEWRTAVTDRAGMFRITKPRKNAGAYTVQSVPASAGDEVMCGVLSEQGGQDVKLRPQKPKS